MEYNRRERIEKATLVNSMDRKPRDGRRIVGASNTKNPVGNPSITPKPLELALEEGAALIKRAEGEDKFYELADEAVSDELFASRIQSTWIRLSYRLEAQYANI